jgi:signal transduction histidine kinase
MRDQFLSVASHELGTPLTSLRLLVDMLQRTLKRQADDDRGKQLLETRVSAIGDQVLRLAGLVDTMLDVSRIAQGRLSLSPEPVDLSVLVRRVVGRMSRIASDAGCPVALDIPGPIEGVWDRERIEQMVSNLLSNAFKYGAGKPVDVEVAANETAARVRVVDRGIGIPADRQAVIFERFARAAPQNQYGGFGLGLWITRRTLQEMGGAIHVESQEGAGARFEIELPRRQMTG